jgi:hypothetical protein
MLVIKRKVVRKDISSLYYNLVLGISITRL